MARPQDGLVRQASLQWNPGQATDGGGVETASQETCPLGGLMEAGARWLNAQADRAVFELTKERLWLDIGILGAVVFYWMAHGFVAMIREFGIRWAW